MVDLGIKGKVAIVTGAARGQGRAHVLALAGEGVNVVAVDICEDIPGIPYRLGTHEELESVVRQGRELGVDSIAIKSDVSNSADVKKMAGEARERFGRVDILVNNAGIVSMAKLTEMDEEVWDRVVDVNLKGIFLCCKHVAPMMMERNQGRIINIASVSGLVGTMGLSHYVSSKAGVVGLTKTLAAELAPYKITVNAVCPGAIDTPMVTEGLRRNYPRIVDENSRIMGVWSLFPDKPILEPSDVSGAVLWLASDLARYVTGAVIPVDAGFMAV